MLEMHIALGVVCISSSIFYLGAGIKLQHPFSLWNFISIPPPPPGFVQVILLGRQRSFLKVF